MPTLVFSTPALRDLAEIEARVEETSGSSEVAQAFVTRLVEKCKRLARFKTRIGRPRQELLPDLRSYPYRSHIIFFRYVAGSFYVVNVLYGARDIGAYFAGEKSDN
jgi:toxin ParE1/3/4